MLVAALPPLVDVRPTREVRTVAPVNDVAVGGGRAATLVGETGSWEYLLVWSPNGVVVRASLTCDTQESNIVLAGNRFAHVCLQGAHYVVAGTLRPLKAHVALRASGSAQVALAAGGTLVAGSVSGTVWRFDPRGRTKVRTYASPVIMLSADRDRLLVDRDAATLDVLTKAGSLFTRLKRPHGGGALMRDGRVTTISGRRLVVSNLDGRTRVVRTVTAGARLEDVAGGLVVYSVETRLHLLRLEDGKDVRLRLHGQFGYAHARLSNGGLFYTYNGRAGRLGHAGFLDAAAVRGLLRR